MTRSSRHRPARTPNRSRRHRHRRTSSGLRSALWPLLATSALAIATVGIFLGWTPGPAHISADAADVRARVAAPLASAQLTTSPKPTPKVQTRSTTKSDVPAAALARTTAPASPTEPSVDPAVRTTTTPPIDAGPDDSGANAAPSDSDVAACRLAWPVVDDVRSMLSQTMQTTLDPMAAAPAMASVVGRDQQLLSRLASGSGDSDVHEALIASSSSLAALLVQIEIAAIPGADHAPRRHVAEAASRDVTELATACTRAGLAG